ncbi:MAG: cytochrome c oxidase subunit II [Candidatus Kapaibacterium sp.]
MYKQLEEFVFHKRLKQPFKALAAILTAAFFTCLVPLLAIAAPPITPRYKHFWLPDAASTYAPKIDAMFNMILWITMVVFFLVEVTMLVFLIKYRYKPDRRATYTHGNNRLEIVWTAIPAVILVYLAIFSNTLWSEIRDPNKFPKGASSIEIRPRQFEWDITYPGPDGKFGTKDDIATINQLYLVKDKPVQIKLEGQDVIHSFFVPEFRIKQDAVPGMPTAVWIQPTMGGNFEIACAELCGLGHYRMKGFVSVVSQDSLDNWLKIQSAP